MDAQTQKQDRSAADLLRELSHESVTLVRQEIELAKTEMTEKAAKIGRNTAYLAAGALVAYAGFLALVAALIGAVWVALARGVAVEVVAWLAPLLVAVVVGVIGYVLIHKALVTIKQEGVVPHKTVETMREDKEWLRTEMKA